MSRPFCSTLLCMSTRALAMLSALFAPVAVGAAAFGEWEFQRVTVGGAETRQALVVVDVPGAGAFGAIVVRCDIAGLSVFVDVGAELVRRRPVAVEFQFDAHPEERARWHPAPDGVGAFAPDPAPFARELAARYHLTFTGLDASGTRHRADYPLIGSAAAIRPVLAACEGRR